MCAGNTTQKLTSRLALLPLQYFPGSRNRLLNLLWCEKTTNRNISFRESNVHSETCKLLSFYMVPSQQLEMGSMRIKVAVLASSILFGFYLLSLFIISAIKLKMREHNYDLGHMIGTNQIFVKTLNNIYAWHTLLKSNYIAQ